MNTLTLDDLLIEPKSVEITVGSKSLTVYVRPLTKIEQELCHGAARRASRDLRRLLEDVESEQHQLLVQDELEQYEAPALKTLWIANRLIERSVAAQRQSLEDRDKHYIPEPEDATPAEMDRYENEVEDIEKQREASVASQVKSIKADLEREVEELSIGDLRADAQETLIDSICTTTFNREFSVQMIARGTFNDEDCLKPTFKTSSQVKRLKGETMELLASAHYELIEDPEEIKN